MSYVVTLIPGDGIGPEVTDAAKEVIRATGVKIEWDIQHAGAAVADKTGKACPEEVLESVKRNRIALKGPIGTPIGKGFKSVNVSLRQALELYACVRPVRSIRGVPSRYDNVNLVIIRENTEGLYSGVEHMVVPGVAESLKIVTDKACRRIAQYAYEYARRVKRSKVTIVHKANIMKITDGMFLDIARAVSQNFPDIQTTEAIVDACSMNLAMAPEKFDVLVMDNLYGDILSDHAAGLVGGLGMVPGANIGEQYSIFEAVHGSAPDIAGKGIANPTAVILSAAMMLEQMGESDASKKIWRGVERLYAETDLRTGDLKGSAKTSELAESVCRLMS